MLMYETYEISLYGCSMSTTLTKIVFCISRRAATFEIFETARKADDADSLMQKADLLKRPPGTYGLPILERRKTLLKG